MNGPTRAPRSGHLSARVTFWLAGLFFLLSSAAAQQIRVQFIHASPNAEVKAMDVYRDGVLWLDNIGYATATPFEDWGPARRYRFDFRWAGASEAEEPFFSTDLTLERPDTLFIRNPYVPDITDIVPVQRHAYILVVAGDPLRRPGQPAFDLFVMKGALDGLSFYPPFPSVAGFHASPDLPRWLQHWRGNAGGRFIGPIDLYPPSEFGEFQPYVTAPGVLFDGDERGVRDTTLTAPFPVNLVSTELSRRYDTAIQRQFAPHINGPIYNSLVLNFVDKHLRSFIIIGTGFLHPPQEGDASNASIMIFTDGSTEVVRKNLARLQWIHNAPYREAETVDLYVNGFRIVDDLAFREATPFMQLPAGLAHYSAPVLQVDVTAADAPDNSDPLFSKPITLLFGETHIAMLAGDPLAREDQPPMDLHLTSGWREQATDSSRVDLLFAHGAPDMLGASIGVEEAVSPLIGFLDYGAFEQALSQPVFEEVLYLARADTREMLALVEPDLSGLTGSAVVVLTSGFADPPDDLAGEDSELALVAALPSGGPLVPFTMHAPPVQPFWYVVGLFFLALAVLGAYQVRVLRLRAQALRLNTLVEERTRELVAEKEKTEAQAHRLEQLDEAKNRFFANISHEFRTPLTLILGPLQDLLDRRKQPEDLARNAPVMHRNARRLLRLINQLLDLSHLESGKLKLQKEPGDLHAFTRDLTRSFVPLAERRRLSLRFDTDLEALPFEFDPDAMEKVVTNLVSNALKFTPEGGKVLVSMKASDAHVEIAVKDTGGGIGKEDLQRIFDRFEQADTSIRRKYEGSGIGLALAKELAELHGGDLRAESEVGFGSTFTVRLPLPETPPVLEGLPDTSAEPEAPELEEAVLQETGDGQGEAAVPEGERPLVLVVEDNADVRAYLRSILEEDYRVLEAEDGEVGLAAAQEHAPDLVLSDVMMPNMDGYEMCRLLKANERLREIPVLLLTAKAGEEATVEGLQSGADDYLAKPFSVAELLARVKTLIGVRQELREKYSREVLVRPSDIAITSEEEVFLGRVLEVVEEHLGDSNFSVDWLAEEVGLSRRQLERRVEAIVDETPAELVRRMRMERASQLLRARAGTVSEVAYAVGFKSAAHFSRVFREAYGETPTAHSKHAVV